MIDKAVAGDEVWVAAGTYVLTATLGAKEGVNIYGGFAGNETSIVDRSKSDMDGNGKMEAWEFTNETILSGQFSNTENIICVITFGGYSARFKIDTQFDGITVANGCIGIYGYGTITINNCIIRDNNKTDGSDTGYWGGINIVEGTVSNSKITNNLAYLIPGRMNGYYSAKGGGIYNDGGTISNCVITNNTCQIQDNYNRPTNSVDGGGIYNNGGTIINCVVTGNTCIFNGSSTTSCSGGGIFNYYGTVANCLVTNNSRGGIYNLNYSSSLAYVYCSTVENNSSYNIYNTDYTYNCITDDADITQFVNPDTNDFHLAFGSQYIDAGSLDNLPNWLINGTDLAGNPRTHDGKISMGAYEYDPSYVGTNTGIPELQQQSGIVVSPSPATDFVTVSGLQGNETLYFYNINGQLLITHKVASVAENVPVGHLPSGIYLLKTSNGQMMKWMKK